MLSRLRSKFKRWQEAGLITVDQTDKILAFEKERKKGKLIKDLTNVGIFSILIGVLSLVASNWSEISPSVKLIGHFILNAALADYMLKLDGQKHPLKKDACVLALFGLFLTFIALIGQIYQLHGDIHSTLLFWLSICTPFVWYYGRTYTVMLPWLAVSLITLYWNIGIHLEGTPNRLFLIGSLISFYLSPLLLIVSKSNWLQIHRSGFIYTFRKLGLYFPAIFANIAILLFYDSSRDVEYLAVQISLMLTGLIAIITFLKPDHESEDDNKGLWYYLILSSIFMILPFIFHDVESRELSAALFIAYWLFLAWLGAHINSDALINWSIRLIILRLFIIYLEVFGDLLTTGLGLITSGIILLLILRYLNSIVAIGRKLVGYESVR